MQRYFYDWRDSGLLATINHHLVLAARDLEGREASPSVGVIDSQSVKTTESGGIRGCDAGKKTNGRKRHIVTDTIGLMVGLVVHSADIQDRDGAARVLNAIRSGFPWLRHVFADGGYAGPKLRGALAGIGDWKLQIVKRSDTAKGFELLLRRWVVERTFCMARPLQAARQGLGEVHRQRPGMDLHRPHPRPHQAHRKTLQLLIEF